MVGICWYEAMAYARWVGKRLPTAAEWQKAGGWPEQLSGGDCNRYPWGDLFDPERTNLWPSNIGRTVPVDAFPNGATPNGIFQMSGKRLGMARRSPGDDPLRRRERPSFPGSPCAGSSAAPSIPISPAKPPASSSPAKESSTAAITSDSDAPYRWSSSGHSPESEPRLQPTA